MNVKAEQRSYWWCFLCVVLIAVGVYALYFTRLGTYPLTDPDEPVYGQVAKEMAAGGGWLTPHYDGAPWFDKPPMFYWLAAISTRILGPTELAARLPCAVLAVLLLLLVYKLASHDFSPRAAFFSAVVMATCLQQIILARAAVTDMTLVLCLTAALYCYRRWLDSAGGSRSVWMALCGTAAAFALLTKGPVAFVLLGGAFLVHLWWTGRLRRLWSADALVGLATALIVGLPWYVAMYLLHRDAFVHGFLLANNIQRFLTPEHTDQTAHWYSYLLNIPVLFVFFLPWSAFLPSAMRRHWAANDGARLAAVWFAVVFVFFSMSKTLLVTYIFPVYPACAIFVGCLWDAAANGDPGSRRAIRIGLCANLGLSLLLALAIAGTVHTKYPEAGRIALVLCAIFIVSMASALACTFLRGDAGFRRSLLVVGAGMCAVAVWLVWGIIPSVEQRVSTRYMVRHAPCISRVKVIQYKTNKPSLFYYLGWKPEQFGRPEDAGRVLSDNRPVLAVCQISRESEILGPGVTECARYGELAVLANKAAARAIRSKR